MKTTLGNNDNSLGVRFIVLVAAASLVYSSLFVLLHYLRKTASFLGGFDKLVFQ